MPLPIILVLGALAAALLLRRSGAVGGWEQTYRLFHFAQANGMEWYPQIEDPGYPGVIFDRGSGRAAYSGARATSGRALDIGNYMYTTGSGDDRTVHRWGFMALRLDRRIPHCVVDARANNSLFGASSLGSFSKEQVLRLEGDFNAHFTLYCPRGYEADALYIFTPDLMALLDRPQQRLRRRDRRRLDVRLLDHPVEHAGRRRSGRACSPSPTPSGARRVSQTGAVSRRAQRDSARCGAHRATRDRRQRGGSTGPKAHPAPAGCRDRRPGRLLPLLVLTVFGIGLASGLTSGVL